MIGTCLRLRTISVGRLARWRLVSAELEWLLHSPNTRYLDIGCGAGDLVDAAARRPNVALAVGVDEHDGARQRKARSKTAFVRTLFPADDVEAAGPFDAFTCVDVLEHVRDDAGFLAAARRVASAGARLCLHVPATPQHHALRTVREELADQLRHQTGEHVREGYTSPALRQLFASAGWRVLQIRSTFGPWLGFCADLDYFLSWRAAGVLPRMVLLPVTLSSIQFAGTCTPEKGNGWLVRAERA